jgi:hypothetical protein
MVVDAEEQPMICDLRERMGFAIGWCCKKQFPNKCLSSASIMEGIVRVLITFIIYFFSLIVS